MKYWIATYETFTGGNGTDQKLLFKTAGATIQNRIRSYFKDFFGPKTQETADLVFEGFDYGVRVKGYEELTKKEFDILRKHIPEAMI